ncbi:hypothetical protein [Jannaschia sp. 2305UL9-9]|uniref:hypothetical protein n=1 Tax=Jannaschia sp. 2305UL9-9 TaxID=3121638 RepID=UPI003527B9F2
MMDNKFRPIGPLESAAMYWGVAALTAVAAFAMLLLLADWSLLQAIFGAGVVFIVVGLVLMLTVGRAVPPEPRGHATLDTPTAPGTGVDRDRLVPRDVNAPSPHRTTIDDLAVSDTESGTRFDGANARRASVGLADPTERPATAPTSVEGIDDSSVAGGTETGPDEMPVAPAPYAPPSEPAAADPVTATATPAEPVITPQSPSEEPVPVGEPAGDLAPTPEPTLSEAAEPVPDKPKTLDAPRDGGADDLKRIKGIGPKLEQLCNRLGFWHFDQIANWTDAEVAWVDQNLEGFKGRVTRDTWVAQARQLAAGEETDFSKRVDKGGVY